MENFPANQEIWMSIDGYLNYEVSSFGRIRGANNGKMMAPQKTKEGYLRIGLRNGQGRKQFMVHRLVAFTFLELPKSFGCIDHIDRNKGNNHICNLRFATHSLNNHNKQKATGTSSQYVGVYRDHRRGKWVANIRINKRTMHIGTFLDEIEAGKAYDAKAKELYGDHARLNFP